MTLSGQSTALSHNRPARVLLVDDEVLIATMVAEQIGELGYVVVGPAHSLTDAYRLAADELFDAALVDWNLDGGNASGVADMLVKRQIPFAFFSGYSRIPEERYAKTPILGKPFSLNDLRRTLEAIVPERPSVTVVLGDA
jgi:CheY-like chemotaxis protein